MSRVGSGVGVIAPAQRGPRRLWCESAAEVSGLLTTLEVFFPEVLREIAGDPLRFGASSAGLAGEVLTWGEECEARLAARRAQCLAPCTPAGEVAA